MNLANIDLTPIFQAIITLIGAVIMYRIVPWIKTVTTERQQELIKSVARTAVFAAEQMYKNCGGEQKYAAAISYAQDKLRSAGLHIDRETIEAAVKEMNDEFIAVMGSEDLGFYSVDDGK